MTIEEEAKIHNGKVEGKIYISPAFLLKDAMQSMESEVEISRPARFVSTVQSNSENHCLVKMKDQVQLHITAGGKQEIVALLYEDERSVKHLTIQRFTIKNGKPCKERFTFQDKSLDTLLKFINSVALVPIIGEQKQQLDGEWLDKWALNKAYLQSVVTAKPELLRTIIEEDVNLEDVKNIAYRKRQLEIFRQLLEDTMFFNETKSALGKNKGPEDVWQDFFERNTWIFGYGLNYVFNSPLNDAKLQQVTVGFNFNQGGKRVDALMKTKGAIETFCFAEIKTHTTKLLKELVDPYRTGCWAASDELSGSIVQVQKSVALSFSEMLKLAKIKDKTGDPTGERIYACKPKSFVIIGRLSEFATMEGLNEDKFSSFELFRQNLQSPQVITFDELYERAKFIVEAT